MAFTRNYLPNLKVLRSDLVQPLVWLGYKKKEIERLKRFIMKNV